MSQTLPNGIEVTTVVTVVTTGVQDVEPRCWRCGRLLGESYTRPWSTRCPRCKARNAMPAAGAGGSG